MYLQKGFPTTLIQITAIVTNNNHNVTYTVIHNNMPYNNQT